MAVAQPAPGIDPDGTIRRDFVDGRYLAVTTTRGSAIHAERSIMETMCGADVAIELDEPFDPDQPGSCRVCARACMAIGRRRFNWERDRGWR